VSVGRTAALDGYDQSFTLGDVDLGNHDYNDFFSFPAASIHDSQFLDNGIIPAANQFNLDYDHMASHNNNFAEQFNIDDYLNPDHDIAHIAHPEIQLENESAETTAILQPPIGASS
jgi:transcriptional activator HAC1